MVKILIPLLFTMGIYSYGYENSSKANNIENLNSNNNGNYLSNLLNESGEVKNDYQKKFEKNDLPHTNLENSIIFQALELNPHIPHNPLDSNDDLSIHFIPLMPKKLLTKSENYSNNDVDFLINNGNQLNFQHIINDKINLINPKDYYQAIIIHHEIIIHPEIMGKKISNDFLTCPKSVESIDDHIWRKNINHFKYHSQYTFKMPNELSIVLKLDTINAFVDKIFTYIQRYCNNDKIDEQLNKTNLYKSYDEFTNTKKNLIDFDKPLIIYWVQDEIDFNKLDQDLNHSYSQNTRKWHQIQEVKKVMDGHHTSLKNEINTLSAFLQTKNITDEKKIEIFNISYCNYEMQLGVTDDPIQYFKNIMVRCGLISESIYQKTQQKYQYLLNKKLDIINEELKKEFLFSDEIFTKISKSIRQLEIERLDHDLNISYSNFKNFKRWNSKRLSERLESLKKRIGRNYGTFNQLWFYINKNHIIDGNTIKRETNLYIKKLSNQYENLKRTGLWNSRWNKNYSKKRIKILSENVHI
jgi:hypothetical protein